MRDGKEKMQSNLRERVKQMQCEKCEEKETLEEKQCEQR